MFINDQPLSAFGFEPVTSEGRMSAAAGSFVLTEIPNTSGAQLTQKEFDRPRRFTVRGRVRGNTDALFFDNRDKVLDMFAGALEVRFTDLDTHEERILNCQMEDVRSVAGPSPEWLTPNREFELVFVATNPFFWDRYGSVVGDGEIPVGTAPTEIVTELGGALSVPLTLTLKDFRGVTVAQLKYDAAVAAGEWLEIRHALRMVRKFTDVNTSTNVFANLDLTVTDFGFFDVTQEIASLRTSAFPTVEVTAGSAISVVNKIRRTWH